MTTFELMWTYPTVLFSAALILVILYWITVVLGALDLDFLEGIAGDDIGELPLLGFFKFQTVPITLSFSFIVLYGWVLSMLLSMALSPFSWWLGTLILIGALILAIGLTSLTIRPLIPLFEVKKATGHEDLIGKVCRIKTGKVDERFGQAELQEEGLFLILQVRCETPNALRRGSQALIINIDPDQEGVFWVEAMDTMFKEGES